MAQLGGVVNALVVILLAFVIKQIPLTGDLFGVKPDLFVELIILVALIAALLQIIESVVDSARGLIAQAPK